MQIKQNCSRASLVLAFPRAKIGGDSVFRSVKESRHLPGKRRWLYRAEGLAVAGLVCALVILGFAWLLSAPG
jgi:hypothetical protein